MVEKERKLELGKINDALREEKWKDVLKECEKLQKGDVSGELTEDFCLSRGIAYIGTQDLEKAYDNFKKAPNLPLAHVFLRNIYTCVMNLKGEARELEILNKEFNSTIALWEKDISRIGKAVSHAKKDVLERIRNE